MSQIKIYGLRTNLKDIKSKLSDVIHKCVVESLSYPKDKRAHRFINLEKEDFYYPEGRTDAYIIIEIMMISGRKVDTKKNLIKMLFKEIQVNNKLSIYSIVFTLSASIYVISLLKIK